MDAAMLWLTVVLALAAVAAAVFAFVQAKSATESLKEAREARDESESARDEAVRLSREANAAFVRQADAQERANELAAAALPKPRWHLNIQRLEKNSYVVVNDGEVTVRAVLLEGAGEAPGFIHPEEDQARDLVVGDAIGFAALKGMGTQPVLRISYGDASGERHSMERIIR